MQAGTYSVTSLSLCGDRGKTSVFYFFVRGSENINFRHFQSGLVEDVANSKLSPPL